MSFPWLGSSNLFSTEARASLQWDGNQPPISAPKRRRSRQRSDGCPKTLEGHFSSVLDCRTEEFKLLDQLIFGGHVFVVIVSLPLFARWPDQPAGFVQRQIRHTMADCARRFL